MNANIIKNSRAGKSGIILALVCLILISGILAGCSSGAVYRGWSGVAVDGDNLYIASLSSKLIGLDANNRNKLFNDIPLTVSTAGSFFSSCSNSSSSSMYLYGTPCIGNNMIFVTTFAGKVFAYDTEKAIQQWSYPEKGTLGSIVGGVFYYNGKVFFGTNDGKVYALNAAATGQLSPAAAWSSPFATREKIWSTPTASGETLFIGSFDKNMYAINISDGTEKWHFQTEGAIINTPIIKDGVVYFGSFDRYFYAVNAQTGQLVWKSQEPAGKWFWANPVLVGSTIYAPNIDGKIYTFDISNGNMTTMDISASPISSSPVLIGSQLIVAAENGKVWSIDTTKNSFKMLIDYQKKVYAPLSARQNIIYAITVDNNIHALNTESGLDLWGPVALGN